MASRHRLRQRLLSRASIGDTGPAELPSSSAGGNTIYTPYRIRLTKIFGSETLLCPAQGSQNLVGLINFVIIRDSFKLQGEVELTEEDLSYFLLAVLEKNCEKIEYMPYEEVANMGQLTANIKNDFSLQPCLSGNYDFQPSTSLSLCLALSLPLIHGWVIDPEVPIYEIIKEFNYDQLLEYRDSLGESEHRAICDGLLNAAENQLTTYGFSGLSNELALLAASGYSPVALLYWRGKLEMIILNQSYMFIYVSDKGIVQQMPDAHYMLFEEGQQENFYFNRDFEPVQGQQFQDKANEWAENKKRAKTTQRNKKKREKRKNKEKASGEKVLPGAVDTSEEVKSASDQPKDDQNAKSKFQSEEVVTGLSPQQDQDLPAEQGSADTSEEVKSAGDQPKDDQNANSKFQSDEVVTGLSPQQDQDLPAGRGSADTSEEVKSSGDQPKDDQNANNKSDELVTGLPPQQDQELPAGQGSLNDAAADLVLEVKPLGQGLVAQQELKSSDEHQDDYEQGVPAASGNVVSHADISVSHEDVQHQDDDLLDNDPFYKFLMNFKERGSSGPYFKGMVAAFATHKPFFYVPYEFILAHDEKLALKIQDNIVSISKDLDKVVGYYLEKNGVESPDDAKTNIIGLPPPKWVQMLDDYLKTIDKFVFYDVYGEEPEALPSPEYRTMVLGYLHCCVAKFRTGRCWYGKWTKEHMKVKNQKEFYIDYKVDKVEDDYQLDANGAYKDLMQIGSILLDPLKIGKKYPPYLENFGDDIKLVTECIRDPVKWERFLQFISYPMGLKPPLVRAAFLCDVFMVANANASGKPARYSPLFSKTQCEDWQTKAVRHPLLTQVYNFQNAQGFKNWALVQDKWSSAHWHVFKFSRHFIQHVLKHTKDKDLIQKVKDIGVVDIWLVRSMWGSIANSVRYLVLELGVEGIFRTAWRHYVGSDYVDDQNGYEEVDTTGDMVKSLVDSIYNTKNSGYVYSEVTILQNTKSYFFTDEDMNELAESLKNNGFLCVRDGDGLKCNTISLRKVDFPASEGQAANSAVVVEGIYSHDYTAIFAFLTGWLNL